MLKKQFITKDSGAREAYPSGMNRDTQEDKPRYDLIDPVALERWADLMARGAKKYGERNWELAQSPEEMSRFKASAWRHFIQWSRGDEDEDHMAAVMFNLAAYEFTKQKCEKLS